MDLHGRIMNLQAGSPGFEQNPGTAYKLGHRDARHAAAELALKSDTVIEAARAVIAFRIASRGRGDLRDNDDSRDALSELAEALAVL